ncbi:helix-turn-helix transcriptional regulator [Candidatus Pacearchaeota archaeon]|nr:helix-turn-helix transcriptional regulator [Candidatus Pacearchaeota archaeon]
MEEKYILVSLEDERARKISEILGNKSCKRILDMLAEKEASETDISIELKMPINTAEYNIKKLLEAGFIEKTSHWWSVKGKKIPMYKISNKYIVISPKKSQNKIKSFIPVFIVSAIFTFFILWYEKVKNTVPDSLEQKSAEIMRGYAEAAIPVASNQTSIINVFLIAVWLGIVIFFIINFLKNERR